MLPMHCYGLLFPLLLLVLHFDCSAYCYSYLLPAPFLLPPVLLLLLTPAAIPMVPRSYSDCYSYCYSLLFLLPLLLLLLFLFLFPCLFPLLVLLLFAPTPTVTFMVFPASTPTLTPTPSPFTTQKSPTIKPPLTLP